MCAVSGLQAGKNRIKNTIAFALILVFVVIGMIVSMKSGNWSVVPDIGDDAITILHTITSTAFCSTSPSSTVITTVLQSGWLTEYIKISASSTEVSGTTYYVVMTTRVFAHVVPMPFSSFPEDVNKVSNTITELGKQLLAMDHSENSRRHRKRKYYPKFLGRV